MASEDAWTEDWNADDTWDEAAATEDVGEGGYKKPRKAKAETVQYLTDFLADAGAPRAAAHNVARELRWEAASVAADRVGGALLEQLARKCGGRAVERLAGWLAPYVGFLVYHRHGSHVEQTLLALLCNRGDDVENDDDDDDDDEDDDEPVPAAGGGRAARVAIRAAAALGVGDGAKFAALASDPNGSHVCRAWLCALAGAPVLAERRARRNERHSHSVDDAVSLSDDALLARVAAKGTAAGAAELLDVARGLAGGDAAAAQKLATSPSGAPTLALLLRLLAVVDGAELRGAPGGGVDGVLGALFELEGAAPRDRGRSALIAFGLSADRAGSVVMEAAVRYASPSLHGVLVDLCLDPAARGLRVWVEDGVANFVVQALLRTAPDGARLLDAFLAAPAALARTLRGDRLGVLSALLEAAAASGDETRGAALAAAAAEAAAAAGGPDWPGGLLVDDRRPGDVREHGARSLAALVALGAPGLVDALAGSAAFKSCCAALHRPWARKLLEAAAGDATLAEAAAVALLDAGDLLRAATSRVDHVRSLCTTLFRGAPLAAKAAWVDALLPHADRVGRSNPDFARVANLGQYAANPDRWRGNNDDAAREKKRRRADGEAKAKKPRTIRDTTSMGDILKLAGKLEKKKKQSKDA